MPRSRPRSSSPDGTRRPLPLARQEDQFLGSVTDTLAAGDYAIEVSAEEKDKPLGSARWCGSWSSARTSRSTTPWPTSDTLKSLATMTGGLIVDPKQLPELIRELSENTPQLDVQQETKKTFWDTWAFFPCSLSRCWACSGTCGSALGTGVGPACRA